MLFKMAASEIARSLGMIVHVHAQAVLESHRHRLPFPHLGRQTRRHKNLFHDDKDKRGMGLSKIGYHFLGGILAACARRSTALAAPIDQFVQAAGRRPSLSGATWAPAYITYGDNNRTAMVRIPYGRLELRLPDGSCNPYLTTAAIIAAGLDGVKRKLDPGKPNNTNLYDLTPEQLKKRAASPILPQNLDRGDRCVRRRPGVARRASARTSRRSSSS